MMIRDFNHEYDGGRGGGGTAKAPSSSSSSTFTTAAGRRRVAAQEGPQAITSSKLMAINYYCIVS
jgi:hypothetical protein